MYYEKVIWTTNEIYFLNLKVKHKTFRFITASGVAYIKFCTHEEECSHTAAAWLEHYSSLML